MASPPSSIAQHRWLLLIKFLLLALLIAERSALDSSALPDPHPLHRTTQVAINATSSSECSTSLSTSTTSSPTAYCGILFAIQSASLDTVGPIVSTMGFQVNAYMQASFEYEVYALKTDGYYADPDRGEDPFAELPFDYRDESDQWDLVSAGTITTNDLNVSIAATSLSNDNNYYEIPNESFTNTAVPPLGGQKSFYISLNSAALLTADANNQSVNEETTLADTGEQDANSASILIGEGTSNCEAFQTESFMFISRVFMGTVYFEKKCPTSSPSISIGPSFAPSPVNSSSPSEFPSFAPSLMPSTMPTMTPSLTPSTMPSIILSEAPSISPSIKVEEVRSGLILSLGLPACSSSMSQDEQNAVADTVKDNVSKKALANDVNVTTVEVIGLNSACRRRHLSNGGITESLLLGSWFRRRLPSGAAAVEFSMIITGEYRPPVIPETEPQPMPRSVDLGTIAEDSINRDKDQFIRDLKDRAPPSSSLTEVQSLAAEAVPAPPPGEDPVAFTRSPTERPTNPPFDSLIVQEDGNGSGKTVLLAGIVAVAGFIFILGAFLLFRYATRRAVRRHEEEMERRKRRRERANRHVYKDYQEAHVEWVKDVSDGNNNVTNHHKSQSRGEERMRNNKSSGPRVHLEPGADVWNDEPGRPSTE